MTLVTSLSTPVFAAPGRASRGFVPRSGSAPQGAKLALMADNLGAFDLSGGAVRVFADTETGGLTTKGERTSSILSLALQARQGSVVLAERRWLVGHAEYVTVPGALAVNGITDLRAHHRVATPLATVAAELQGFMRSLAVLQSSGAQVPPVLIGHNLRAFDLVLLRAQGLLPQEDQTLFSDVQDTLELARQLRASGHLPPGKNSLGELVGLFGREITCAHDALADTRACAWVWARLDAASKRKPAWAPMPLKRGR